MSANNLLSNIHKLPKHVIGQMYWAVPWMRQFFYDDIVRKCAYDWAKENQHMKCSRCLDYPCMCKRMEDHKNGIDWKN